jgi:hypothetical protein
VFSRVMKAGWVVGKVAEIGCHEQRGRREGGEPRHESDASAGLFLVRRRCGQAEGRSVTQMEAC